MSVVDPPMGIKRFWLAIFLGGPLATVSVTLLALIVAATWSMFMPFTEMVDMSGAMNQSSFLRGVGLALMMTGFHWVIFFVIWPITWLVWWLTMRGLIRQKVTDARRYMKRGTVVGICLVSGVTTLFGVLLSQNEFSGGTFDPLLTGLGSLLTGTAIGAAAGAACGAMFVGIVRPAAQIGREIDVNVF